MRTKTMAWSLQNMIGLLATLTAGCAEVPVEQLPDEVDEAAEALPQIQIEEFFPDATGNGCPAGSWVASGNAQYGTLQFTFSALKGTVPPKNEASVGCGITIPVQPNGKMQSAIASATLTGSADLSSGTPGFIVVGSLLPGATSGPAVLEDLDRFKGKFTRPMAFSQLSWSPCSSSKRLHRLTVDLRVSRPPAGNLAGSITIDRAKDIKVVTRACS